MSQNPYRFFDPNTNELHKNSLGYSQLITTLTAVGKVVSVQKFYELAPADFLPIVVGNGAFQRSIINWRTYVKGEGFETGIISNASNQAQIPQVDAAYDTISQNIHNWAKSVVYNVFELEEAMHANTLFSLIEARELSRRKQWDLGIQKIAFMGYGADKGLLNQAAATTNTTTITKKISAMSAAEFNTFVGAIYENYRSNTARTAKPTHFIMPESDLNGLVSWPDSTYPLRTKLELLTEAFKTITANPNFKILPCAYCDKANSPDATNNYYVLLNYDQSSLKMDLPVDYTMTQSGSFNGFTFENIAYGSFSGVCAQREKELMYFTNTAT
ncbi:MAG: major capsid family protein [Lentisphaerota bacterium]